jgi:SAM-dependent methyltransferase
VLGAVPAEPAGEAPRFPTPDRPVAAVVSAEYSTESERDAKGEADRVMAELGIRPGLRVADIGAGLGYYTVRLARRLGATGGLYATDVSDRHLARLRARLERERIGGVTVVLGGPRDPRLPAGAIDLALLSHVYHEIENPYEFFYRLHHSLAPGARVAIIDMDKPTRDHGTPLALLRCELGALGYREVAMALLAPADGYLAVFVPPAALPAVEAIAPSRQ